MKKQPVDYAAPMAHSTNPPAGLDLPPRLNKLHCRECGEAVTGLHCPKCQKREGSE